MSPNLIASARSDVLKRISKAALDAGRSPDQVTLVAVSKTKPAEVVRRAYEAGQRDFGENYVQELTAKAAELHDLHDIRWHLIGHLQTNKVKQVVKLVHMVQTVDSVRLARELAHRAEQAGKRLPTLIEVNVGGEEQKSGVTEPETREVVDAVRALGALELRGLMTVPPFDLDAGQTAPYFERLRRLRDELGGPQVLPELSMGMSHDFEVAIRFGATMVRVGTSIFGTR